MKKLTYLSAGAFASLAGHALAAGGDIGDAAKQSTNWTAIIMFGIFVVLTLWITKWAASRTRSAADFYTAGGGIWLPERPRHRWRLYVRGFVPRHFRCGHGHGL